MKIYIGKYPTWIGPYQIANMLQYVGVSEDRCDEIGEWLSTTKLTDICSWIYNKRKRKVDIKLHDYDTWNADSTLAIIILPVLKQLKENQHGSPMVDDEDVPSYLRKTNAPPMKHEFETDIHFFQRWNWVFGEIIWTFEQLHPSTDWEEQYCTKTLNELKETKYTWNKEKMEEHSIRIDNGLRLFGKYYRALWD